MSTIINMSIKVGVIQLNFFTFPSHGWNRITTINPFRRFLRQKFKNYKKYLPQQHSSGEWVH